MTDDRLSPSQAAAYIEREWHLRVHPDTVRRWATKGALRSSRDTRGRVLIAPDDVHAIFDAGGRNDSCPPNVHDSSYVAESGNKS